MLFRIFLETEKTHDCLHKKNLNQNSNLTFGAFSFRFRKREKEDPNAWSLERNLTSSDVIQAFLVDGSGFFTTELKHVKHKSNLGKSLFYPTSPGCEVSKKGR